MSMIAMSQRLAASLSQLSAPDWSTAVPTTFTGAISSSAAIRFSWITGLSSTTNANRFDMPQAGPPTCPARPSAPHCATTGRVRSGGAPVRGASVAAPRWRRAVRPLESVVRDVGGEMLPGRREGGFVAEVVVGVEQVERVADAEHRALIELGVVS